MEGAEIYQRLNGIFREVFDDNSSVARLNPTDDVNECDSLSYIRLLLAVEKTFDVNFSASEIGNLNNLEDLVELIQKKL